MTGFREDTKLSKSMNFGEKRVADIRKDLSGNGGSLPRLK
jgi:hypothetical protein